MAYAAITSLKQTLEEFLDPASPNLCLREDRQAECRNYHKQELSGRKVIVSKHRFKPPTWCSIWEDYAEKSPENSNDYEIVEIPELTEHRNVLYKKEQIECLKRKLDFFQAFVEDSSVCFKQDGRIKNLECQIRDVASNAEHVIESHIYDCVRGTSKKNWSRTKAFLTLQQRLRQVIEKMDIVEKLVLKFKDSLGNKTPTTGFISRPTYLPEGSLGCASDQTTMVGFADELGEIRERVAQENPRLDIISIIGMGGIGKTTLARKVYNDPYIMYYFHIRAWVTVSEDYDVRKILLCLLGYVRKLTDEVSKQSNGELAGRVYRSLKRKRFLIIMDDVWTTKVWDDVKSFFPDDNTGSRIILTSRLKDVAIYANPTWRPYELTLLNMEKSWSLLRQKVFVEEECPPELEDIGKEIANRCQGLPLAIVVLAGHLAKISKTKECWAEVAENVGSLVRSNHDHCLDILALSYHYLPCHLKACFLYMGAFPEDYEIPAWRLIRLWVAEGFLQAKQMRLEEVAEKCLQDLISRSLITVRSRRFNGTVKTCGVHDLLRDLSMREAQKENFLCTIERSVPSSFLSGVFNISRISCLSSIYGIIEKSSSPVIHFSSLPRNRSFLSFALIRFPDSANETYSTFSFVNFKLLRVLDIVKPLESPFDNFPIELTELIHLRYLALAAESDPPSLLCRLRNLETLVYRRRPRKSISLPSEIWMMQKLRHLHFTDVSYLPEPMKIEIDGNSHYFVLPNLLTLSIISPCCCTRQIFTSFPNLKKLVIRDEFGSFSGRLNALSNLIYLQNLETLKCSFDFTSQDFDFASIPRSLKKLTVKCPYLPMGKMVPLAMLPNLEVLKLSGGDLSFTTWKLTEECFSQLKFLQLESLSSICWRSSRIHFPRLQRLVFKSCRDLEEIPRDTGEIDSLELIELRGCSLCACNSAKTIQDEQQMNGNELNVRIYSPVKCFCSRCRSILYKDTGFPWL